MLTVHFLLTETTQSRDGTLARCHGHASEQQQSVTPAVVSLNKPLCGGHQIAEHITLTLKLISEKIPPETGTPQNPHAVTPSQPGQVPQLRREQEQGQKERILLQRKRHLQKILPVISSEPLWR